MPDHVSRSPNPNRAGALELATPPNMRLIFERPDAGTELSRTVTGPNPPATVEVRFVPLAATERLTGQPSGWCNSPAAGQDLVYGVPVTVNGTTNGTLTVTSTSSPGGTLIPVRIKHNV